MSGRTISFGLVDPFGNADKYLETELRHRRHRKSQFYPLDEHRGIQRVHFYLRDKMRLMLNGEHPSDFQVRDPDWHLEHVNSDGTLDGVSEYHFDGGYNLKEATEGFLILWATFAPTEVLDMASGENLKIQETELVAIHNKDFMHRTPWLDSLTVSKRWFAKSFVYAEDPLYETLKGIATCGKPAPCKFGSCG
jgi:hypothetical protein